MSDLVPCPTCGKALSPYVLTCPYCGRRTRTRKRSRWGGRQGETHVLPHVEPPDLTDGQGPPPPPPAEPKQPIAPQAETPPPVPPIEPQPVEPQPSESQQSPPREAAAGEPQSQQAEPREDKTRPDQAPAPREAEPYEVSAKEKVEVGEAPRLGGKPPENGQLMPSRSEPPPRQELLAALEAAPLPVDPPETTTDGDEDEVGVEPAATSQDEHSSTEEEAEPVESCVAPREEEPVIEASGRPSSIEAASESTATSAAVEAEPVAEAVQHGHEAEPLDESDVSQVAASTHLDAEPVAVAAESPIADAPEEEEVATAASDGNGLGPAKKTKNDTKGIFLLILVVIAAVFLMKVFVLG